MEVTTYLKYQNAHKIQVSESWPWWKFYGAHLLNKITFRLAMVVTELHIWIVGEYRPINTRQLKHELYLMQQEIDRAAVDTCNPWKQNHLHGTSRSISYAISLIDDAIARIRK